MGSNGTLSSVHGDEAQAAVEATQIAQHLSEHAGTYWPRAGAVVGVRLLSTDLRTHGRLYWYELTLLEERRRVVAKVVDQSRLSSERLRLAQPSPPTDRFAGAYEALRKVRRHFDDLGDPHLGGPPILDHVPANGALIFERVAGTSANRLVRRNLRYSIRGQQALLLEASHRAGRWLSEFHRVDVPRIIVDRSLRSDFLSDFDRYVHHLESNGRLDAMSRSRVAAVRARAEGVLPAELPLGLAHGDFAWRNVLIDSSGRVVVIDTLARRFAPVFEDISTLIVGMRTSRMQVLSHGAAFSAGLLESVERAVLAAYFGDRPPVVELNIYATFVLLDRWAALVPVAGAGRMSRFPPRGLADRFFKRELERLMSRLA
jgi:aminoglycoside phosphotransferase (APT) family kinase protein